MAFLEPNTKTLAILTYKPIPNSVASEPIQSAELRVYPDYRTAYEDTQKIKNNLHPHVFIELVPRSALVEVGFQGE
jgi:hypothetical protein